MKYLFNYFWDCKVRFLYLLAHREPAVLVWGWSKFVCVGGTGISGSTLSVNFGSQSLTFFFLILNFLFISWKPRKHVSVVFNEGTRSFQTGKWRVEREPRHSRRTIRTVCRIILLGGTVEGLWSGQDLVG